MKRNLKLVTGAIGAYAVIVVLLTVVESGADGASIRSIWDAIWYSVITLTTVGYGDLSPVTGVGRVLGIILAHSGSVQSGRFIRRDQCLHPHNRRAVSADSETSQKQG